MSFVPWFSFSLLTPNFLTYLSFDAGATNRFIALLIPGRGEKGAKVCLGRGMLQCKDKLLKADI